MHAPHAAAAPGALPAAGRQYRPGHERPAGRHPEAPGRLRERRPRAPRRLSRHRQDHAGQGAGPLHRRPVQAGAVHARPPALGHPGRVDLRSAGPGLSLPPRAHLHRHPSRRRDQPRLAPHPVRAARGHGGRPDQRGRHHLPPRVAVLRHRHPESGGVPRHLSAARSADGPLRAAVRARLRGAGRRGGYSFGPGARPSHRRDRALSRHRRRGGRCGAARARSASAWS